MRALTHTHTHTHGMREKSAKGGNRDVHKHVAISQPTVNHHGVKEEVHRVRAKADKDTGKRKS